MLQPGARLHYAVPQILARHGLLKRLYTDLHAEHRWLRAIDTLAPDGVRPKLLRRMLGRRLPDGLPAGLVRDFAATTLLSSVARSLRLPAPKPEMLLLRALERDRLGPGDTVYTTLFNEDVETMQRLKDRGVRIVHECMLAPNSGLLMLEEERKFPGIEPPQNPAGIHEGRSRDALKYALSDLILVPSSFTRAAVEELNPTGSRIATVPYGFDLAKIDRAPAPEVGRVLFVGSVGLRKGNPDLAEAARILARREPGIAIRVVGPGRPEVLAHPAMAGPTYVGQVPRSQVFEEFRRADIFVLPSRCEGLPVSIIEAMAMGLPVIATPACGDAVRDGIEGFVVDPAQGGAVLADRIATLVGDRDLRARMSDSARARVNDYALAAYGERLVSAIVSV